MGMRVQARQAWAKYLEVDPSSGWAVEARARLGKLTEHSRRFDRRMLDEIPPDQLMREFPYEAHSGSELWLLADWADAEAARTDGSSKLAIARRIGIALAAFNGEHLLSDAVAAVDAAQGVQRDSLI